MKIKKISFNNSKVFTCKIFDYLPWTDLELITLFLWVFFFFLVLVVTNLILFLFNRKYCIFTRFVFFYEHVGINFWRFILFFMEISWFLLIALLFNTITTFYYCYILKIWFAWPLYKYTQSNNIIVLQFKCTLILLI